MFFRRYHDWLFAKETQRAILLLSRLNDDDVASPIARAALASATACIDRGPRQHLAALIWTYAAYSAYSEFVIKTSEVSEFEPSWLIALGSANQHIWERCQPHLGRVDKDYFEYSCPVVYRIVSKVLRGELSPDQLDIQVILRNAHAEISGE